MKPHFTAMIPGVLLGFIGMSCDAETTAKNMTTETMVDTLLKRGLEVAPGTDVIIDRVTLAPKSVCLGVGIPVRCSSTS